MALLKELMRTRQRVMSRVILAAMMSTGMMNDTQDMMTKMPETSCKKYLIFLKRSLLRAPLWATLFSKEAFYEPHKEALKRRVDVPNSIYLWAGTR